MMTYQPTAPAERWGFFRALLHRYVQDGCWKSRVNDYILKLQDWSHCCKHLQLALMPHYMSTY